MAEIANTNTEKQAMISIAKKIMKNLRRIAVAAKGDQYVYLLTIIQQFVT